MGSPLRVMVTVACVGIFLLDIGLDGTNVEILDRFSPLFLNIYTLLAGGRDSNWQV